MKLLSKFVLFFRLSFFLFLFISISCEPAHENVIDTTDYKKWTCMFYLAGDNNLEYNLLKNIQQIEKGYQGGVNVIIFIDRSDWYSNNEYILGEKFSGVKILTIDDKGLSIENHGELFTDLTDSASNRINSADAGVLKRFIEYSKKKYTTEHYALFFGSHGDGARSRSLDLNSNVIYSETYNDWIYTAEFTDVLDSSHSVDILAIDSCFMGNFEFIYQLRKGNGRFSADYIVASAPTEWSKGWNYENIFRRFSNKLVNSVIDDISFTSGQKKVIYSPFNLSPLELGKILIDEHYDYTFEKNEEQVLSLFSTSNLDCTKKIFDLLCVELKDNKNEVFALFDRNKINQNNTLLYFNNYQEYEWTHYSYFDVYDFCEKIKYSTVINQQTKNIATDLQKSLKNVILYSFGGTYFKKFLNNTTGLSFFLSYGDEMYNNSRNWYYQTWYNAISAHGNDGRLSFCIDNAIPENGIVENYFEVLCYWFNDNESDVTINGYEF